MTMEEDYESTPRQGYKTYRPLGIPGGKPGDEVVAEIPVESGHSPFPTWVEVSATTTLDDVRTFVCSRFKFVRMPSCDEPVDADIYNPDVLEHVNTLPQVPELLYFTFEGKELTDYTVCVASLLAHVQTAPYHVRTGLIVHRRWTGMIADRRWDSSF